MPQLGGKSFIDRNSGGTPILQRSDTGTVNWTTGWVNTDGTTTVADGAKLTFNHNLGTTDITVDVFVCDNASGTGEVNKLEEVFFENTVGSFVSHGCQVQDITNEQLTVSLSYYGYAHWSNAGTASTTDSTTTRGFGASNSPDNKQKYIKVVATAGSGSGSSGGLPTPADSSSITGNLMHHLFTGINGTRFGHYSYSQIENFSTMTLASRMQVDPNKSYRVIGCDFTWPDAIQLPQNRANGLTMETFRCHTQREIPVLTSSEYGGTAWSSRGCNVSATYGAGSGDYHRIYFYIYENQMRMFIWTEDSGVHSSATGTDFSVKFLVY